MKPSVQTRLDARARVFKALAHPSRLFIVEQLAAAERCVCELTGMIEADISTVSKHLSVLKRAGIVADRRCGTQIFYRLAMPCVLVFFDCVSEAVETNARRQVQLIRLENQETRA